MSKYKKNAIPNGDLDDDDEDFENYLKAVSFVYPLVYYIFL